jgi:hypothetical protein
MGPSLQLGSLGSYRDCVAAKIGDEAAQFEPSPHLNDVHLASSCLQKALRRGDRGFALASGFALLRQDPERLWRRLSVCAFEDFGLTDLELTARVVAAIANKPFRVSVGEDRLLAHLIGALCASPKDRRLDDLYALGAIGRTEPWRLVLRDEVHGLSALVGQAATLIGRCERVVPSRSFRVLAPRHALEALREMRLDEGLDQLLEAGLRQTRCLLPLLVPLAFAATQAAGGLGPAVAAPLPEVPVFAGLPAYAIDGFTRSGRRVLGHLQRGALRSWLAPLPYAVRADVLHHLLFFAEGGVATPLHRDPLSQALHAAAVRHGTRLPQEALAAFAHQLPLIHRLRRGELTQELFHA